MIHFFDQPVSHIALPERFTYPFNYTPHPLCVLAAEEVKAYISTKKEWLEELTLGKMFGVLVVTQETEEATKGRRIFLYRLSCCFFRQSGRKESASVFRPTCLRFAATTGIL